MFAFGFIEPAMGSGLTANGTHTHYACSVVIVGNDDSVFHKIIPTHLFGMVSAKHSYVCVCDVRRLETIKETKVHK